MNKRQRNICKQVVGADFGKYRKKESISMGLNTKLGPAKSFLVKLDASGAKVEVLDDAMEDNPKYLYHATNFCNL